MIAELVTRRDESTRSARDFRAEGSELARPPVDSVLSGTPVGSLEQKIKINKHNFDLLDSRQNRKENTEWKKKTAVQFDR